MVGKKEFCLGLHYRIGPIVTPYAANDDYGEYMVKVSKAGYTDFEQMVHLTKEMVVITATLSPEKKTKVLTVESNLYGADIYINNQPTGMTPMVTELLPGKYTLKVELHETGYDVFTETITIEKEDVYIYALLTGKHLIKIELPVGTQIWIDGIMQNLSWEDYGDIKPFILYAPDNGRNQHFVEILCNGIYYRESMEFVPAITEEFFIPLYAIRLSFEKLEFMGK